MIHEKSEMQRTAAIWHFVLAIGALGGVIYHAVATVEHWRSMNESKTEKQ